MNNLKAVKYLNHSLDTELILMEQYNLDPNEMLCVKTILLAQDGEYEYLQNYAKIMKENFRLLLESLQSKGVILKSYKIPKSGEKFDPENVQFNQNFLKRYYRGAFEMGQELFHTYPQSCVVNNQVFNLRSVSHKFDSLEQAFQKYAKQIKNDPDVHKQILDDIKWGIENGYNFTTLDRFIVDMSHLALRAFREGNSINMNMESVKLI